MKKIVIGRSNDCDVVIKDTTDVVSRHQAVIIFTFFGKMTLYDTSINGTFINDVRMDKSQGEIVTKDDNINFGHVWDLDWSTIKDPYRKVKAVIICAIVGLLLIAAIVWRTFAYYSEKSMPEIIKEETVIKDAVEEKVPDTKEDNSAKDTQHKSINKRQPSRTEKNRKTKTKQNIMADEKAEEDNAAKTEKESPPPSAPDKNNTTNEVPLIY